MRIFRRKKAGDFGDIERVLPDWYIQILSDDPVSARIAAAVMMGSIPARIAIEQSAVLQKLWGDGGHSKAKALVAVWSAGILNAALAANSDLQETERRMDEYRDLTESLFTDAGYRPGYSKFVTDALIRQYLSDEAMRIEGGMPSFFHTLLLILSATALGAADDLSNLPIPIEKSMDWQDAGLTMASELNRFEDIIVIATAFNGALRGMPNTVAIAEKARVEIER